jgi:hypothetical protein
LRGTRAKDRAELGKQPRRRGRFCVSFRFRAAARGCRCV